MYNIFKVKILIVGLTTVLGLASFNESDFRKNIIQSPKNNFDNKIQTSWCPRTSKRKLSNSSVAFKAHNNE